MRRLPLALACIAALTLAGTASATANIKLDEGCSVETHYDVDVERGAWVFKDREGGGTEVTVQGPRLLINGRPARLSAADQQRLGQLASEFEAVVPEAQAVAVEAIDIAFTALIEVGRGFDLDADDLAELDSQRDRLRARMAENPGWMLESKEAEAMIEPLVESVVAELVPKLTGAAISQALALAFSGDEARAKAFETRMEAMEANIETKVEQRAQGLEQSAMALCGRLQRIDQIENGLEVRRPDGKPINLLSVRRDEALTASR